MADVCTNPNAKNCATDCLRYGNDCDGKPECARCSHRFADDPCICLDCDPETKNYFQEDSE